MNNMKLSLLLILSLFANVAFAKEKVAPRRVLAQKSKQLNKKQRQLRKQVRKNKKRRKAMHKLLLAKRLQLRKRNVKSMPRDFVCRLQEK